MPYRTLSLPSETGPEAFLVRVSHAAIAGWLAERDRLRTAGYPDRPPDIDTETLRAWLPRPGEDVLPYFSRALAAAPDVAPAAMFGVYLVAWTRTGGGAVRVIVTGRPDGAFLSRVVIEEASGACVTDKFRLYGPDLDPDALWADIERIVAAIAEHIPDAAPRDPLVTTYLDFLAVDVELGAAKADALAAGLLEAVMVH